MLFEELYVDELIDHFNPSCELGVTVSTLQRRKLRYGPGHGAYVSGVGLKPGSLFTELVLTVAVPGSPPWISGEGRAAGAHSAPARVPSSATTPDALPVSAPVVLPPLF